MSSSTPRSPFSRALFVRLDRIGDLVLTLPVEEAFPGAEVDWWIPPGLSFVTLSAQPPRRAREVAREFGWTEFAGLIREIRRRKYDLAVVFHAPWWVGLALWLARVPVRVGVRSQWHSFLFFNRGVRQKRSRAEHSELEYNYRLIESGLGLPIGALPRNSLRLAAGTTDVLNKFRLQSLSYTVVHPGMGGSALNWPSEKYVELIKSLSDFGTVAITGTPSDEPFLKPLRERLSDQTHVIWLDGKLKGDELITVLSQARAIVAPSTGVLHLAASTGRPTIGIFSPVRVQHPRRWGPQGAKTGVVLPQVDCPGELTCLGPQCPHYNCMEAITPQSVLESLRAFF
jgi:ADP-heptose:LPS heptosyltransferase